MSQIELVRLYVNQYLANVNVEPEKSEDISLKIAQLIESDEVKLIELVKSLGDYLTSEDDLLRPKATSCLSSTLKHLGSSKINQNDTQVLNTFFVNKISDVKSTKEALIGLSSLIDKENFGIGNIKPILETFENDYTASDHLASCRFFTFEILNKLIEKFEKYIEKIVNDLFIRVFIKIASGEKDPKNLLISFKLNKKITSSNFKISEFQDDLFDVLFCYFPISFRPPKDDPYKITSDQLKSALRSAIASTSKFDKDSYPNLLEKISSTSLTVKTDTILTINECIKNYGEESLSKNWIEIWNGLKFEIIHGDDENKDYNKLVITTFKLIGEILSTNEDQFNLFWSAISKELIPNIKNNKHLKPTIEILTSIASSSVLAFNIITNSILLLLLNEKDLNVARQRALITNIGLFSDAYISLFGTFDNVKISNVGNSLLTFKDEILIILGKSLMSSSKIEVSLRTIAITELIKLITLSDFINESELGLIVQYFTETVLVDDYEYVYNSAIGGLVQVSKVNISTLLEVTFPTLLSLLPDDESKDININDEVKPKDKIFEIISSIGNNKEITDFLIYELFGKLKEIGLKENNIKYSYSIASTMKVIIENSQRTKQFSTDSYLKDLFNGISELIMEIEFNNNENYSLYDDNVIDVITDVIKLIVTYSSKTLHQELIESTFGLFYSKNNEFASESYYSSLTSSINISETPRKSVYLLTKILAGVDKSVEIPKTLIDDILNLIENQSHSLGSSFIKAGYLELISLLINKWASDVSKYESYSLDSSIKIEIYTWISKGIILRIDPKSEIFIDNLVNLLSNDKFGLISTKSFEILVIDLAIFDKFKKINNNNVRLLYKQRFIQLLIPKLVEKFNETDSLAVKSNYLTALSYVLKHSKREMVAPFLSSFFPLLLQSLSLPNSEVRFASVQTILSSIDEIPELISKHLQTLIPQLLKLSNHSIDKLNSPNVRLVSLNVLQSLTFNIPLEKLIPYQAQIIKSLETVLDDKKRSVRKGAVDTRQAYYELGRSID